MMAIGLGPENGPLCATPISEVVRINISMTRILFIDFGNIMISEN